VESPWSAGVGDGVRKSLIAGQFSNMRLAEAAHGTTSATSANMVRLTVTLRPSARGVHDLVDAFRFLIVSTRIEPGCLGCSVWTDPDLRVHYVEEWSSEMDIRRRVGSDRFTSVLALLESVREAPHVQFDFVSATRGLDYVEEVRQHGAR
jgi:quinol monooxygenase YgiN